MNRTTARLVAVGDSVSEGVGDPGRDGLRGWIHYMAAESAGLTLVANLARSGATVSGLRRHQLDRAVALAPDVVTCTIGVNDVIAPRFDVESFERDYDHVIGTLTEAAGMGVLTMTLHDIAAGLPLPRGKRAELRRRVAQANDVIERVSERYDTWVIDARVATPMGTAGMLSVDRLHPNRRGHRYIAAFALDVLRAHGVAPAGPRAVIPEADSLVQRIVAEARHVLWIGRYIVVPVIEAWFGPARRPQQPRRRVRPSTTCTGGARRTFRRLRTALGAVRNLRGTSDRATNRALHGDRSLKRNAGSEQA
jgi:lysophospholipase L1-like esterase